MPEQSWIDLLSRLMQGLPLTPAPPPGGMGDQTEPVKLAGPTVNPQVLPGAGLIPSDSRLRGQPYNGDRALMPPMADPQYSWSEMLPAELAKPQMRGTLPPSLNGGEIMDTYTNPQLIVNDNAGQRNTLTDQERLEQIMQQMMLQNLLIQPGPRRAPTNTQDPPRLRLI